MPLWGTNGLACCIDLANGDYDTGFGFSTPAAMAGYPHITVPMGFAYELPAGLSFIGNPYSEGALLSLAYGYEQASRSAGPRNFLKTCCLRGILYFPDGADARPGFLV